jgi:hypothetical protein
MLSPLEASMGGGAGPGREVAPGGEPGHVADLDQQPGGAGGPDAVQVEQAGAGLLDELDEFLVRGLLPRVYAFEVDDEFQGDAFAGLACCVLGPDTREELAGLCGR